MPKSFVHERFTWLAYMLLAFYVFFLNSLGPLTPFIKAELNLTYTVGSLLFSAFAVGMLCVGMWGHLVIERIGRRWALWMGALGISLGAGLLIFAKSPVVAIAATFGMGLVGSLILSIIPSALADLHGENGTVAIAEANVICSLAGIASPLLMGWSENQAGDWRFALGAAALVPVLFFLLFRSAQAPEIVKPIQQESQPQAKLPVLFWVYWIALVLAVAVEFCMISWSADFMENILGMAKSSAAQSVSVFLAGMVIGRMSGSRLLMRFSSHTLVLAASVIAGIGFALFWLGGSVSLGLAGLLIAGIGVANFYPLIISLALMVCSGNIVQANARTTLASGTAILALPLTLGRLADGFGIQAAYGVVPVLLVGVAGVIIYARRRI